MAHRIDVHHHILPPEYVAALARLGIAGGGGIPFPAWGVEETLAMMDRQDIAAAVTSVSSPGVHFGDASAARDLARRCNEVAARLVADHPTRFGAFATLPLPDVGGALGELEHALDVLRLDGVVLLASQSDGRYLGDPRFDELFAELERRAAVVFIHPTVPRSSESIPIGVPGFAAEFTFDTTRAVANLIWTGTAERCPRVRFVLSHAGGTAPFLAWRWSLLDHHPTIGAELRPARRAASSTTCGSFTTTPPCPPTRTPCGRCASWSGRRTFCSAATTRSRPRSSPGYRSTAWRRMMPSTPPRSA